MKNVPIIMTVVLCFFFQFLSAQSVILINGVPTEVKLQGDEILEVKGEVSNYLTGFDSSTVSNNFQYAELRLDNELPAEVVEATPARETVESSQTVVDRNISSPVSASSPFISGNYFKFNKNSALLSETSLKEIKAYAEKIKSGKANSVLLESFHVTDDAESMQLVENRLQACKNYFEVSGVPTNVIVTNMYPNDKESDKVSITLR